MDQGAVIATGSPAEVTADARVIEAYLGEEATRA
jgi:branched-chain amino acid transport system ATP-binding protein